MVNNDLALLVGWIAFIFGLSGYLIKNKRQLSLVFGAVSFIWALHFYLLGGVTASFIQVGMGIRTWFSISLYQNKQLETVYIITTSVVFLLLMSFTWQGVLSTIPTIAAINSTIAYTRDNAIMRYMFLLSSLLWIINALLISSMPSVLVECFAIVFNLLGILRLLKK